MPSITAKLRYVVFMVLMAAMIVPAAASASANQFSIMMDDDLLVYRNDAVRDAAMRQMKGLGVDIVRVTVLWSVVGENANTTKAQKKRFKRLGADNPKAYPKANWDRYDRLDRACKTLAIKCYFNVTGPGLAWTHKAPPKKYRADAKQWKPNPRLFYKFVQAVGKRYSGKYQDENDGHVTLPRIDFWSLWNEPNQGGWLRPQFINNKPASPAIYRDLYLFGHRALVSTGHGSDIILAGETAPLAGSATTSKSAMGPKQFINEMLCGPGSTGAGCSSFTKNGPIQATAWAHHPYTKKDPPNVRNSDPNAITLANFGELGTLLDNLANSTHNIRSGMPLMSTEFGYETNPPDPFAATTQEQQADYLELAEEQTFADPRILANTQFLLRDVAPNRKAKAGTKHYWGTYQSGLETAGGGPKPALQAYIMPFVPTVVGHDPATNGPIVNVFGMLRFLPNVVSAANPTSVQLQWAPAGTSNFVPVGPPQPVTNYVGYYVVGNVGLPGPGLMRAVWSGPQVPGGVVTSRAHAVS